MEEKIEAIKTASDLHSGLKRIIHIPTVYDKQHMWINLIGCGPSFIPVKI